MELRIERGGTSGRGVPVYRQIADQIRRAVVAGALVRGDRLPTIRGLASQLGVNRDTVSLAYETLAGEGVVESTVGRGTFVASEPAPTGDVDGEPFASPPPLSPLVDRLLEFGRTRPSYSASNGAVPLHSLIPDPTLYPVDGFRRSLDRALARGGSDLLVYGGPEGHEDLRAAVAERLCAEGIEVGADEVVIAQGASQGISLALRLFAAPGDWVAVEEPTYHNLLAVLVGLGLRPTPVPMTPEGPDLDVLGRVLARPEVKAFYTMPSFHNPMGTTTGLAHRRRLLEVAARRGRPVVEDAFEMDLRFDGRAVPPLAALDGHGLVVHLFSFSKSLFPGVRIGSITARGRALEGLKALKRTIDLSGVPAVQAAVADFVRAGAYDRHLARLRKTLRTRRDAMVEALREEMPAGTRFTEPEGGYQVWVELPGGVDTGDLLEDARRAGVLFAPGSLFHHDGRPSACLRLTFALAGEDEIRRGVRALGEVARARLEEGPRTPRDEGIYV
jgi:DNA-binding transcriptional MocR family regulator